jgi:nitrite reductase/ring-hydroxylating ferredoxin subunit
MTSSEDGWHDVAGVDDVDDDDVLKVTVGQSALALYRVGGEFFATDDRCTHQEASLSDGYLQDRTIECPRHQGVFDIVTGKALSAPATESLRTYPVRVENERVWIQA